MPASTLSRLRESKTAFGTAQQDTKRKKREVQALHAFYLWLMSCVHRSAS